MGVPTNSKNAKDLGCAPVSSNCVIWQGPDLDCVDICAGDTITIVLAKMAVQLCSLIEMFDINDFDFSCFNLQPSQSPQNTGELIQVLIDRICALENITPVPGGNEGCPTGCLVLVADCFITQNQAGDDILELDLIDYVRVIAQRVCDNIDAITLLQAEIATLQSQIDANTAAILVLETDKADVSSLQFAVSPLIDPTAGVQYVTNALGYIQTSLINTNQALGTPSQVFEGMAKAGNIDTEEQLCSESNMATLPGWIQNPNTLGEDIGNIWLAIRDIRCAVEYMQDNCCATGCTSITLNFRATIDDQAQTVTVYADGSTGFTPEWAECTGTTTIRVTDALGNITTFSTSLLAILNDPAGYTQDISGSSIDTTIDVAVVAETCFKNTSINTTCEKEYCDVVKADTNCPVVIITALETSMNYSFSTTPGYSYIANVYYRNGSSAVATQNINTPGVTVNNTITGLVIGTEYDFVLTIIDGDGESTDCPIQQFETAEVNCVPAQGVTASISVNATT